jgi:hypothetical protein
MWYLSRNSVSKCWIWRGNAAIERCIFSSTAPSDHNPQVHRCFQYADSFTYPLALEHQKRQSHICINTGKIMWAKKAIPAASHIILCHGSAVSVLGPKLEQAPALGDASGLGRFCESEQITRGVSNVVPCNCSRSTPAEPNHHKKVKRAFYPVNKLEHRALIHSFTLKGLRSNKSEPNSPMCIMSNHSRCRQWSNGT